MKLPSSAFFDTKKIKSSLMVSFWLMLITFPIMVIKINYLDKTVTWRWANLAFIGIAGFFASYIWNSSLQKIQLRKGNPGLLSKKAAEIKDRLIANKKIVRPLIILCILTIFGFPYIFSMYNTSIMTTALIYMVLGLGLNIIIGLGGLLHLGYAAFFAVGSYTYALLYQYFGIGFWAALPLGGMAALIFGILLGIPVLRLRGDYLAIVTLAFGEILRIVLTNLGHITGGPDGISRIPRPGLFGLNLSLQNSMIVTYYLMVLLLLVTIIMVRRLENSRIGRALEAMKEDEVAAESMGINIMKTKLTAFALGSFWAGIAGVVMAAKTTKVTPDSFGLMESVTILCIVVLGGMGSIPGILLGTVVFKLVMEYFRIFSNYRMLIFGAVLVIMMVFKPSGLIAKKRHRHHIEVDTEENHNASGA